MKGRESDKEGRKVVGALTVQERFGVSIRERVVTYEKVRTHEKYSGV